MIMYHCYYIILYLRSYLFFKKELSVEIRKSLKFELFNSKRTVEPPGIPICVPNMCLV